MQGEVQKQRSKRRRHSARFTRAECWLYVVTKAYVGFYYNPRTCQNGQQRVSVLHFHKILRVVALREGSAEQIVVRTRSCLPWVHQSGGLVGGVSPNKRRIPSKMNPPPQTQSGSMFPLFSSAALVRLQWPNTVMPPLPQTPDMLLKPANLRCQTYSSDNLRLDTPPDRVCFSI